MDDSADLERVSEMADVLAERIFASVQNGELTVSDSPEARLLLQAAKMLETRALTSRPECVVLRNWWLGTPRISMQRAKLDDPAIIARAEIFRRGPHRPEERDRPAVGETRI